MCSHRYPQTLDRDREFMTALPSNSCFMSGYDSMGTSSPCSHASLDACAFPTAACAKRAAQVRDVVT
jgi:hypothetical protein